MGGRSMFHFAVCLGRQLCREGSGGHGQNCHARNLGCSGVATWGQNASGRRQRCQPGTTLWNAIRECVLAEIAADDIGVTDWLADGEFDGVHMAW